ncbi:tetratricopeptide repeat protein [Persephonella sp.]
MSGFKLIFIIILIFTFQTPAQENTVTKQEEQVNPFKSLSEKEASQIYREAVQMYKRKSYYSALNLLTKLITHRDNIHYADALFLAAKIYLELGRKTGKKSLIQKALNYINKYSYMAGDSQNWDYYYTKGNIYENLYMYERALALYKLAFYRAITKRQQFKTVAAILRTAAWTHKMDLVTRYIVLVNIEELSHEEKKEFEFIEGLLEFQKGNYEKAYSYLSKVYKEYEPYLIENPYYYYIFAENTYRIKKYEFAKQLFRRIISLIKDEEIIRRSLLRLGDIFNIKGDKITAFNYYYSIVEKYPDSQEAVVAKLKILSMEDDKKIREKIYLLKKKDEDFKKPLRFVYKMLVSNRNTYIGNFAIGNFGKIVFESGNDSLFSELVKELSLIYPERMLYEQMEYIRKLWSNGLMNLQPEKTCELYKTNRKFFKYIFDRKVLLKIVDDLKICSMGKDRIDLAKWILEKWNDDKSRLALARVYFEEGRYRKSLKVLSQVKNKDCNYTKLYLKNNIELNRKIVKNRLNLERCKNDPEILLLQAIINFRSDDLNSSLEVLQKINKDLSRYYLDPFFKKHITRIIGTALSQNRYKEVLNILKPVSEKIDDCNINSWLMISMIRTGSKNVKNLLEKISNCDTLWSSIARNVYEDSVLIEEVSR